MYTQLEIYKNKLIIISSPIHIILKGVRIVNIPRCYLTIEGVLVLRTRIPSTSFAINRLSAILLKFVVLAKQ